MNIDEFINERKGEWEKLERIASKFRSGRSTKLTRDELWDMGRLYSAAVSDLSLLKSSELAADPDNDVIAYLNDLVIRIHRTIYRNPAGLRWSLVGQFLHTGFPSAVRRNIGYIGFSAAVFVAFSIVGFLMALADPAFIELLVPQGIIATVEKGDVWFKGLYTVAPMASGFLMTHNISVTFLTFAAGVTFGLGTVYLLAVNGLLLGTIAALCMINNLSLEFWSFVLPHGSVELSAIFLAGGGGLILGHALLDPGPYRRGEFLSLRSRQAVQIVLGCVPLLVVAGLVEAFLSPSPLPPWIKLLTAVALFTLLLTLIFLPGAKSSASGDA